MARKDRNLASFGDVANTIDNKNNNITDTTNVNVNDNVNDDNNIELNDNKNNNVVANNNNSINKNDSIDFINELLNIQGHKDKYAMRGIYIEKDLASVLDMLGKKGGRGTKSKIVNEALRKVFSESGLI